jgi:nucleotide-binding universal stress UspA family protein
MAKILIGIGAGERAEDAIAFGHALALAADAAVLLATVLPSKPAAARHDEPTADALRPDLASARLTSLALPLLDLDDVELRVLVDRSAARALHLVAEEEHVGLIVIGSGHTGRLGRVFPGSTAERVLHGSPCPVAVVPAGYRGEQASERPVVGCAYRPTPDGEAALGAAEELALALSASLWVAHVTEPLPYVYDEGASSLNVSAINASIRADAERTLSRRMAHLSERLPSDGTVYDGKPADVLSGLSRTIDILVMGSRGLAPLKAVLLGGVSGQVIRSAACPVIVVPRGARSAVGSVFADVAPHGGGDDADAAWDV